MPNAAERVCGSGPQRAGTPLRIHSRRFGTVDVSADEILSLPQGMLGLPESRRYALLDGRPGSPFKLLLSIDDPELAFAVVNPQELVAGYEPPLAIAARVLGADLADVALFAVVTVASGPSLTVNLMAPLAVDTHTRCGRQLVLDDGRFAPAHPIIPVPAPRAS